MNGSKLEIRPGVVGDYEQIAALLDRSFFPVDFEKRKKLWSWRYSHNPAFTDNIPSFLIAEKDDKIAGVHGFIPIRLKVGNDILTAAYSCDYAADPEVRGAGMKLKLATLSEKIAPLHVSTSANEQANKITIALGGKELNAGKIKLIKGIRYQGIIRAKLQGRTGLAIAGVLGIVMGLPLNLSRIIMDNISKGRMSPSYELRPVSAFGKSHDDLWLEICADHVICIKRDSQYLNWRYTQYPFGTIRCWELLHNGKLAGILAIYHGVDSEGLKFSAILETISARQDIRGLEIMLTHAVKYALQNGSHYITAGLHNISNAIHCRRLGFLIRASKYSSFTFRNSSNLDEGLLANEGNWYFSQGDGDICYYFH